MSKTAIILGATGLTGGKLLRQLIADDRYEKIILFSRSSVEIQHEKIEEHLVDLFKLEEHAQDFKANEVFCCIGTTKSKTPDEETYVKIDKGIPVTAAKLAKANGIRVFTVISAIGADANSKIFYNKTKGEMEREVLSQNIEHTYIFQPSLIAGDRAENRSMEDVAIKLMSVLNYVMVGPLEKYKSIHSETIARAMVRVANTGFDKKIIVSNEIREIAAKGE